MHVKYSLKVVGCEFTFEILLLDWMQSIPGGVNGEEESELGSTVETSNNLRREDLVKV